MTRMFENGGTENLKIGKVNKHAQLCLGTRETPGTDQRGNKPALAYAMLCLVCNALYGANEGDVWHRKCPNEKCTLYNDEKKLPPGAPGIDF